MKNDKGITRRRLVQGSLGVAALSATGGLLAAGTPAQTEGPFFPIHPQPDTDADMTLIEGHTKHALGEAVGYAWRSTPPQLCLEVWSSKAVFDCCTRVPAAPSTPAAPRPLG